jgi:hypothetical protein
MAAGEVSYDSNPVYRSGNLWEIHGTLEAESSVATCAILGTKHYIVNAQLVPEDSAASYRCELNKNAAGTSTAGTLAVTSSTSVGTFRFKVQYA